MHFSRQLAAFVRAGIPLIEALEVIEEEADDKTLRMVLPGSSGIADHRRHVLRRRSARTRRSSRSSTSTWSGRPSSPEASTMSSTNCRGYIKRDLEARNKIKSALMYPVVILVMAIGTVIVLVDLRAAPLQDVLRGVPRRRCRSRRGC